MCSSDLLFAQRSTYASARTSPRISGISDCVIAAFEMEGNRTILYNCCLSLATANATDGRQFPRQAVTEWRRFKLCTSTRLTRSSGRSGRNVSHGFEPQSTTQFLVKLTIILILCLAVPSESTQRPLYKCTSQGADGGAKLQSRHRRRATDRR